MLRAMQTPTRREEIAANVRAAKARRRVSDSVIADALNLPRSGVSERMNGHARWQIEEIEALTEILDVPLEQLLARNADQATA